MCPPTPFPHRAPAHLLSFLTPTKSPYSFTGPLPGVSPTALPLSIPPYTSFPKRALPPSVLPHTSPRSKYSPLPLQSLSLVVFPPHLLTISPALSSTHIAIPPSISPWQCPTNVPAVYFWIAPDRFLTTPHRPLQPSISLFSFTVPLSTYSLLCHPARLCLPLPLFSYLPLSVHPAYPLQPCHLVSTLLPDWISPLPQSHHFLFPQLSSSPTELCHFVLTYPQQSFAA